MKNKIAIQGELGAYSHLAANNLFKKADVLACKTFEDVSDKHMTYDSS